MTKIVKELVFESLEAEVALASGPGDPGAPRNSRTNSASSRWDDGVGFEGAVKLALEGWKEGVEKIKEMVDQMTGIIKPQTHQVDVRFTTDGGGYVDISRFLEGEPECFGTYVPPERPTKPFTVAVNYVASGGVPASKIMMRGAAIAAAVDVLESVGYTVELWAVCVVSGNPRTDVYRTMTLVKQQGQSMDLDRIAFVLVHPAMPRRIEFGVAETFPAPLREKFNITSFGGYGWPADVRPDNADLYFGSETLTLGSELSTPAAAAAWVRGVLTDHGLIEVEEE